MGPSRFYVTNLSQGTKGRLVALMPEGNYLVGLPTDTVETLRASYVCAAIYSWNDKEAAWRALDLTPAASPATAETKLLKLAATRKGIPK